MLEVMMNPIDVAFLIFAIYGIWTGFNEGFIGTILMVIKFVFSVLLALRFSTILNQIIENIFQTEGGSLMLLFSFVIAFVLAFVVLSIIGTVLNIVINKLGLGLLNRLAGIVIWMLMLTTGFGLLLHLGEAANMITDQVRNTSRTYPYLYEVADFAKCKLTFVIPAVQEVLVAMEALFSGFIRRVIGACS